MRRVLGMLALVVATIALTLLMATDVAAAQTSTTTTTAPPSSTQPMLPTTTNNSSMPQTGFDTAGLAGIAVSAILIGYGICSIGRGVRIQTVP